MNRDDVYALVGQKASTNNWGIQVLKAADVYTERIEHLEGVKNLVIQRWPGDRGVCFVIDEDFYPRTFTAARKARRNIYDTEKHGDYPVGVVHCIDGELYVGAFPTRPYLRVIMERGEYYVALLPLDDYSGITRGNFYKFAAQRPPGLKSLPPDGEVVKEIYYE